MIRSMSSAPPSTGTPWSRRRRRRGSSSTKPTTCSPGVSRSSRRRLLPPPPAATMRVRRRPPRPAAGAKNERPPLALASFQHGERAEERPLAEPRRPDEDRAEEPVDDEDALREVAPRPLRREDEQVGGELREADGGDRRRRLARARVAPHAAVEPERD